jgi:hypothetical protein
MAWVDGQAFRLFLPACDDVFIGCEALSGFEPFGNVVGIEKVLERLFERLLIVVVIACDGGLFPGAMQAFDLAMGPGRAWLGEAMLDPLLLTRGIEGRHEG